MDEPQTLTTEVNLSRVDPSRIVMIALALIAIVISVFTGIYYWQHSDPYVQEVIALQGQTNRGHAMFQMNCAGCHGLTADGKVGPSLRGVANRRSQRSLMYQITSGNTPPMPKFQVSPAEMSDLLSYLKTL